MNLFDWIMKKTYYLLTSSKYSKKFRLLAFVMSCIVVFSTTYAMILPALTMEKSVAEETPGIYLEEDDYADELLPSDNEENIFEEQAENDDFYNSNEDGLMADATEISDEYISDDIWEDLFEEVESETETETETETEIETGTENRNEIITETRTEAVIAGRNQ